MQSYLNKWGVRYYLPEFGLPVRWVMRAPDHPNDLVPAILYYECDVENACMRAIHIHADGRILLAYPGGPDGDYLPEGPLSPAHSKVGGEFRETSQTEFNSVWLALSATTRREAHSGPLLGLTSSTEQAAYAPFVGTWMEADAPAGRSWRIQFSTNGVVVSTNERNEFDLFRYDVKDGVAMATGYGSSAAFESAGSQLRLQMSGQEVRFNRVE